MRICQLIYKVYNNIKLNMTESVQRFLLANTKWLQYLVNEKLAKRSGAVGKFFKWMEVGPRSYGQHFIPRYFRVWNTYMLDFRI